MAEDSKLFLGIDTSNYTTSVALCNMQGEVLYNGKKLLDVKDGERGLRQSDALFAHTKNLPEVMSGVNNFLDMNFEHREIVAVGYSARPRDVEGSYMPCFLAGVAAASSVQTAMGCKSYGFSHQQGHVMAALYSSGKAHFVDEKIQFAAFHVSGGTTEFLLVTPRNDSLVIEKIGGSRDMNAGQAIDRIGVLMGLKFPSGREMEQICSERDIAHIKSKICVNGLECNLSGLENLAARVYADSDDKAYTAAYCFDFIADTLKKITENYRDRFGEIPVIFAGGVMSNGRIKRSLVELGNVWFSSPEFSSDNAAGTALLCRRRYLMDKK